MDTCACGKPKCKVAKLCKACRVGPAHANWNGGPRHYNIRRSYGITMDDYDAMFKAQDGRCAICRGVGQNVGRRPLGVDHDHTTLAIRGLLCRNCNATLGLMGDDPERLNLAAAYLRRGGVASTNQPGAMSPRIHEGE